MARNKRMQDRHEKCDEIISAARALFLDAGYESTTMSKLAVAAGVAPNTIYWYFKDKDEVLVAVLNAELSAGLSGYLDQAFPDMAGRLFWVARKLQVASRLVSTVHARLPFSPEIRGWHERFHQASEALIRLELQRMGMDPERINAMVKVWVFTLEGLLAHEMPDEAKLAICTALTRFF